MSLGMSLTIAKMMDQATMAKAETKAPKIKNRYVCPPPIIGELPAPPIDAFDGRNRSLSFRIKMTVRVTSEFKVSMINIESIVGIITMPSNMIRFPNEIKLYDA